MKLYSMEVGMLQTNCYILGDEESNDAVVIDPGGNADEISNLLKQDNFKLKYVILTHAHFDHCLDVGPLVSANRGKVLMHKNEMPLLKDTFSGGNMLNSQGITPFEIDEFIKEGDTVTIGRIKLDVLDTPGHSLGHISLLFREAESVFVGDTLFAGSIGRTDFPGGSHPILIRSVKEKIFPLGDKIKVYPGHGPMTTVGREKEYNPFF